MGDSFIERKRNKKENNYIIESCDDVPANYEALKGKVPEDIQGIFNITELNIQKQTDPYFFLGRPFWSPGEVARFLNNIVHLDQIDKIFKLNESKKREAKREFEYSTKDIQKWEKVKEENKWYDNIEKRLKKIDSISAELEKLEKEKDNLCINIQEYCINIQKIKDNDFSEAEKIIESIEDISNRIENTEKQNNLLDKSIRNYNINIEQIKDNDFSEADKLIESIEESRKLIDFVSCL